MGKRVVALLLAIVMLTGAFSLHAFAELQTSDGMWNYSVVSGGAKVLKYNGEDTVVTVPEKLGDYKTVALAGESFKETPAVVLNLPESVNTIESNAFSASSLKAVYIPKTVTSVPTDAGDSKLIVFGFNKTGASVYAAAVSAEFIEVASSSVYDSYVGKKLYIDTPHQITLTALDKYNSADNRIVTGEKAGTGKVLITFANGISAPITVKVKAAPAAIEYASVINLYVGDVYNKLPSITNGTYPKEDFRYKIYDTDVATVDANGYITALKPGTTKLLIVYNGTVTTTATVNVGKTTKEFHLNYDELTIGVGEVKYLEYSLGKDEIVKKVTYTSSNTGVVAVSAKGKILAKGVGTATITAQTNNGLTDKCVVTVGKAPTKIKLAVSALTMAVGENVKFKVGVDKDAICSE